MNTSLNASLSESDATDREIVESLKETFSVIKSKSQSMNKDLLNSYQLGVAASCSNLKTVSKHQAAKRLYCMSCIDEDFDNCQNKNYLDAWNEQQMKVLVEPSTKVTRSEPEPDTECTKSLANLASVGTIVTVAAHLDPNYDYHLLQVTTDEPILLQEEQVDDYGCPMPAGSRVLKGHFFSCEYLIDMTYHLDEKKVVIINVKSVRCICFDLKEVSKKRAKMKIYKLSLEQHEEIMANC